MTAASTGRCPATSSVELSARKNYYRAALWFLINVRSCLRAQAVNATPLRVLLMVCGSRGLSRAHRFQDVYLLWRHR